MNLDQQVLFKRNLVRNFLQQEDSLDGWNSIDWTTPEHPFDLSGKKLPFLELQFPFDVPYLEMLNEAKSIKDLMVSHRMDYGYGWRSIAIHGLEPTQTRHHKHFGYTDEDAPYVWTEIADKCPVTKNFFQNIFGYEKYFRIRFMLLEPDGFILPHVDKTDIDLRAINIGLNMPEGCIFRMKDYGNIPFGQGHKSFLLDTSIEHALINESQEDRIHIIVHGNPNRNDELWNKIYLDSFQKVKSLVS